VSLLPGGGKVTDLRPVYRYRARCLRIIDADTLDVDTLDVEVDLGFRTHIRTPLRLLGLNAPERNTEPGRRAIEWVAVWISKTGIATNLVIDSARPGDYSGDKYGRWLATVWDEQGRCLNTELLAAGHAVPMEV
jgi:micrococcal nuclease